MPKKNVKFHQKIFLDNFILFCYNIYVEIRTKEFFTFYAPGCRKRHFHSRVKNEILEFVVQLEVLVKARWYPVIRYDTSHKFAHCDILHWKGKKEKIAMPTLNTRVALTFADEDLSQNWSIYRERFLKEVPDNER